MNEVPLLMLLAFVLVMGAVALPFAAREGRMRRSFCEACGHSQWMHHKGRGLCWHYKVLEDRMCDCQGGTAFKERT